MKAKIKLSLYALTAVRLLALLRNVVAKLTGNALFPTPPVTMAELTAKGDELEAAIALATEGSKASKAARNARMAEAKVMLTSVADYVRMVAQGDEAKLLTTGFEMAKRPEPVGVPGTTRNLTVRGSNSARTLELRWRRVHGAHGYRVWKTESDPNVEANWQPIGYTTRASHVVADLESLKAYWFCVSAIGVAGEGRQCDPAMGRAA